MFALFSGLNENSKHIMDIKLEDIFEEIKVLKKEVTLERPYLTLERQPQCKHATRKPRAQNRAPAACDARAPNPGAQASSHLPESAGTS